YQYFQREHLSSWHPASNADLWCRGPGCSLVHCAGSHPDSDGRDDPPSRSEGRSLCLALGGGSATYSGGSGCCCDQLALRSQPGLLVRHGSLARSHLSYRNGSGLNVVPTDAAPVFNGGQRDQNGVASETLISNQKRTKMRARRALTLESVVTGREDHS